MAGAILLSLFICAHHCCLLAGARYLVHRKAQLCPFDPAYWSETSWHRAFSAAYASAHCVNLFGAVVGLFFVRPRHESVAATLSIAIVLTQQVTKSFPDKQ